LDLLKFSYISLKDVFDIMSNLIENRAGKFVMQKGGYPTVIPESLPPRDYRDLLADENIQLALSNASAALARLDGVTQVLPNPDLFVAMYVKKEALLSSQILKVQDARGLRRENQTS
jgi:hypothetical protein